MKKGLLILVALSIALLMSASMLVAQEKACAEKEKGTCKKEMKLTDEQKTKIEEMKMNLRLKMIDLKAEREKLGIALKKEMAKPEPTMKDIEGIVKKMSAVREKMQLAGIEHKIAMRKLLGPDACKNMHFGMGMGRGMHEMGCCGDEGGFRTMRRPGMKKGDDRMMRMGDRAPRMGRGAGHGNCSHDGADKEVECKIEIKEEAKKK